MSKEKSSKPEIQRFPKENLEKEIPPELAKVVKELSQEDKKTLIHALSVEQHYSGPLPDGETIKIYNKVIPNGGDRLMTTVEKQLEHRIDIERTGVRRTFNQSSTGQWMGMTIVIIFGFIAWDLGRNGHTIVASILGAFDLVSLAAVFVFGRLFKK